MSAVEVHKTLAEDEEVARTFLADNHAALVRAGSPFRDSAISFVVRVFAECEAKRRIVVRCQEMLSAAVPMAVHLAQQTLADLGRPLADHPDYRESWRP